MDGLVMWLTKLGLFCHWTGLVYGTGSYNQGVSCNHGSHESLKTGKIVEFEKSLIFVKTLISRENFLILINLWCFAELISKSVTQGRQRVIKWKKKLHSIKMWSRNVVCLFYKYKVKTQISINNVWNLKKKVIKTPFFLPFGLNLFVWSSKHFFNMHKKVLEKYWEVFEIVLEKPLTLVFEKVWEPCVMKGVLTGKKEKRWK